jgi:hypothetical protein
VGNLELGTTEYINKNRPAGPQQHTHNIPTETNRGPVKTVYINKK